MSGKRSFDEVSNTATSSSGRDVWVKRMSTKYGQQYWFNETTGKSVWQDPMLSAQASDQISHSQTTVKHEAKETSTINSSQDKEMEKDKEKEKQEQNDKVRRRRLLALSNPTIRMRSITDKQNNHKYVVFDDAQCIGGTKQRLLSRLLSSMPGEEFIYAGPDSGLAQVALAYCAYIWGKKATIFLNTARSKGENKPPALVKLAMLLGGSMKFSDSPTQGRTLQDTQEAATRYWEEDREHRTLMPFGLKDDPGEGSNFNYFREVLCEAIPKNYTKPGGTGAPTRLWIVAGSGFIFDVLASLWPTTTFMIVQVGKTVWPDQLERVKKYEFFKSPERFGDTAVSQPPFQTVPWYDAKLWRFVEQHGVDGDYIWNVGAVPSDLQVSATVALEACDALKQSLDDCIT